MPEEASIVAVNPVDVVGWTPIRDGDQRATPFDWFSIWLLTLRLVMITVPIRNCSEW